MLKTRAVGRYFKTQPVGRYIAAVSFGSWGAFYGARSAARACLERIVQLEDSKLGELATNAVRASAPLDPMLAKAPNASHGRRVPSGDAHADVHAEGEVGGGLGAHRDGRMDAAYGQNGQNDDAERGEGFRAAVLRAAAEAEASRRVRERLPSRPSPPVVDLSEEPRASSTSASTSSSTPAPTSSSGDGFVGFDLSRDAFATAGMRGGDAWATVGHVSDTSDTGQGDGGGGGGSGARGRSGEGTRERRRAKWAERANRRVDGADASSPFLGEESRPTPDMFDAGELDARRERQRAGRARPRATIRTEYGDVMDRCG